MRYLGIDYGTKRVGLALSDESGVMAFAHSVVTPNEAPVLVAALIKKEAVETVVLGESLNLGGTPNPVQVKIARFKDELEKLIEVPVVYSPEFMTSAQAARPFGGESAPTSRSRKHTESNNLDSSAAALILQGYLDRLKNTHE